MTARDHDFTTSLEIENRAATLRVRGNVDDSSAEALRDALSRVADHGPLSEVTADLSEISSMDAAGLAALVGALREVRRAFAPSGAGRRSPRTRVVVDTAVIEHFLAPGRAEEVSTPLGDEMHTGDRSAAVASREVDVTTEVARVGSAPASYAVVDAALRLVTKLAAETVEGADGVSVSLQRHGRLATVAASNDTVLRMDAHQYDTGEGPCIAASEAGHWFHIEALSDERRWTSFVPRAMEEGIASILSTPLLAAERPLGALNIYSTRERVFGPRQQELAALFSEQASGILEDAGGTVTGDELDRKVLSALRSREIIAQAQGVIMAGLHVTPQEAVDHLRDAARATQTTVVAESARLLASTQPRTSSAASHG